MKRHSFLRGLAGLSAGCAFGWPIRALAQEGVVRLGQSASLTGGQARYGKDVREGLLAALAHGNQQGASRGLRFELVTLDDGGSRDKVQANVQSLVNEGVSALIGLTSGAGAEAVMGLVEKADIPLIGVASGNMGIRSGQRQVFHVRAGYDTEYRHMLAYIKTFGLQRVAYVYLQDTSKANAQAMTDALAREQIKPVALVGIERNAQGFSAAVAQLMSARPDCVLFTTNAGPVVEMSHLLHEAGFRGLVLSSSFAGQELVEAVAGLGRPFILSTVVPRPVRVQYGVVRQCAQDLAATGSGTKLGLTVLEGYIAGRVAVAAALAAGKSGTPGRAQLLQSLAGLRLDLGGYVVDYTGGRRGSDFVDVISVDRDGRMIG